MLSACIFTYVPMCTCIFILRALSLYSMFDGSRQGVFWLVGGKTKTYSFAFVGEKNSPITACRRKKKKIGQTSSKIDSTDHVFYSDDSVACYVTCNNLQFIELTFSSPLLGIFFILMGILVSIFLPSFRQVT